ncbi:NUDIX hydrolase [Williamsia sp. CHRR-6]|uniref:NUDIX hydrolase n=1 Tax=Williamsia sp. CHRR-6 TaxID=2835871 RepID=UPI001BD95C9F|nr:NUDIX hydrolase [Williamsia sp. CHRR-6]MBT0566479.1 NUDIX hydrolase [Williamsia sp. CHRR-6]
MSTNEFPPFAVTVDLLVATVRDNALSVLLITRGVEPFLGAPALPGGFVHINESAEQAAHRELLEETGLAHFAGHLEQLGTYSTPDRDPRMRVVSVAYVALAPHLPDPQAGTDAAQAMWCRADDLPALAFDHDQVVADGLERIRAKLEYTTLAVTFVSEQFTIRDLQTVYEVVWGITLDRANFRRKVLGTPGFVVAVDGITVPTGPRGKPAQVYRRGPATVLRPPILRPI